MQLVQMVTYFAVGLLGVGGGIAGRRMVAWWLALVLFGVGITCLYLGARLATQLGEIDKRKKRRSF